MNEMISKSLRIRIFNWLGAGKLTLRDDTKETQMSSGYTLNTGTGLSYNYNSGLNTVNLTAPQTQVDVKGGINFTVAQATGGWIVQINHRGHSHNESPDLYIIPDGADFDRELGKIITMSCLKG
jgi:hypothetical protein